MRFLSIVMAPAAWLLNASTELVLRLLPMKLDEQSAVTEEEINLMLREGAAAGHFHLGETAIAQMALRLGDRRLSAVMTPRTQVEWLNLADSDDENKKKIVTSRATRAFPVIDGDPQAVVGVIQVKDLLIAQLAGRPFDIRAALAPAALSAEHGDGAAALEMLKKSGEPHGAGGRRVRRFRRSRHPDRHPADAGRRHREPGDETDPAVVMREDGSWLIDGMVPVDEVKDAIGLMQLPGEEGGDFHTLGGLHDGAGQPRAERRRPLLGRGLPLRGRRHGRATRRPRPHRAAEGEAAEESINAVGGGAPGGEAQAARVSMPLARVIAARRHAEQKQAQPDDQEPKCEQADGERKQTGDEFPKQKRIAIDRLREDARERAPVMLAVDRIVTSPIAISGTRKLRNDTNDGSGSREVVNSRRNRNGSSAVTSLICWMAR